MPYTGDYRIEAIGAAGGYDTSSNGGIYRGRGARMKGFFVYLEVKQFTFSLVKRVELTQ